MSRRLLTSNTGLLEEAKLRRMPRQGRLRGESRLVTGGAGGIGAATAARLVADGACVILVDLDAERLEQAAERFDETFGSDRVRAAKCDVTSEDEVTAAFEGCAREFGGLDILVANAGIASSAPLARPHWHCGERTIACWPKATS